MRDRTRDARWCYEMAQRLRQALPGVGVRVHMGGGQLKKQFKRADASGATWAVLFGAQTTETDLVVKHLRDASIGQQQLPLEHAITLPTIRQI